MTDLEKLLDELQITKEDVIYSFVQNGKINVQTAIKFHSGELSLEEIIKQMKNDTRTN